ncbi:hypothetical protein AAVH_32129, partial [Aphelenchoides avenae]
MRLTPSTAAAMTRDRLFTLFTTTALCLLTITTGGTAARRLSEIPLVDVGGEVTFHANESAAANFTLHYRTESRPMEFGDCLEVRFRVEGKRT